MRQRTTPQIVDESAFRPAEAYDGVDEVVEVEDDMLGSHIHAFNICRCGNINIFFDTEVRDSSSDSKREALRPGVNVSNVRTQDVAVEDIREEAALARSRRVRTVGEAAADALRLIAQLKAEVSLTGEAARLVSELNALVGENIEQGLATEKRRLDLSLKKKRQLSRELKKSLVSTKKLQNQVKLGQTLIVTGAILVAVLFLIVVFVGVVLVMYVKDEPSCFVAKAFTTIFNMSPALKSFNGASCDTTDDTR
jgi:hypothetical protein